MVRESNFRPMRATICRLACEGMTRHHPEQVVVRDLFFGLDVLVLALLVVAVVQAAPATRWVVGLVCVVLLGVYVWGRFAVRVHERPIDARRGIWFPDVAWMVGLLVPWAALLWLTPGALWIAFPLMLLQMHVLGPGRGLVTVAVTTALTVSEGLLVRADETGQWVGYVLGPVIGAAVAVGGVLGLEALARESQARQRTVEELTQARRDLAAVERERAVAGERERLAREIHDTLAQSFSAIELLLRTAESSLGTDEDKVRALIDQARDAARASLADARHFVHDLAPPDLDRSTLVAALQRLAERVASTPHDRDRGEALTVSVRTSGEPCPLPVAVETALLRVAQSALANVTQHADASHAQVTLTYDDDVVILDVVDDGRGFDPAVAAVKHTGGGFGIDAMRSRVRELGGTLSIETSPGHGTALAVTLPIPPLERPA